MEQIADGIYRIPPCDEPLSSDVFIMEGRQRFYLYDAGCSDEAWRAVSALDKPVTAILSHFHRDHTGNLSRLDCHILGGARTCKTLGRGQLVNGPVHISDGINLCIQPCTSPHAPGCLILTLNDTYTLIGDLAYAQPGKGQGEAIGMFRLLSGLNTQYILPSHQRDHPVIPKADYLAELKKRFGF